MRARGDAGGLALPANAPNDGAVARLFVFTHQPFTLGVASRSRFAAAAHRLTTTSTRPPRLPGDHYALSTHATVTAAAVAAINSGVDAVLAAGTTSRDATSLEVSSRPPRTADIPQATLEDAYARAITERTLGPSPNAARESKEVS